MTVEQLLAVKRPGSVTISADASVYDALVLMAEHDIGAVVVVDNASQVVGVLSERDYARKIILHDKHSRDVPVSEIMTRRVVYVTPCDSLDHCMALVTERHVRHLPVMDGDALVGVLSIGDLVKATLSEQAYTIRQLEMYVTT
jgi:CBS domain-containing protein